MWLDDWSEEKDIEDNSRAIFDFFGNIPVKIKVIFVTKKNDNFFENKKKIRIMMLVTVIYGKGQIWSIKEIILSRNHSQWS